MRFFLGFVKTRNITKAVCRYTAFPVVFRPLYARGMSIRLFEGANHAQLYAKYRPTYTSEVYDEIKTYCQLPEASGCDTAVDIGCGNGQSTVPLTNIFKAVIGRDISEKQITEAKKHAPSIDFSVGPAEDLSFLDNETVDLVTTAQALHWMDRPRFFKEVERVLRPGGALVVYGYGNCTIDRTEAQRIVWQFYKETLDGYWDKQRGHIDNHLATIELPFKGWSRLDTLSINRTWDMDSFIGYMSSWSAWQTYLESHPSSSVLEDIRQRLNMIYTDEDTQEVTKVEVTWPIYMLMGRKPND
ncbi:putative methyltransferase DDB_G0268948 isoform X1 [Ylistrum balloti]|uniref:putative methyltransferase DDB_G0268948 isoform X1 n=1 Tax=Ylistrum balloti TaxID=509963 RepID=UPI002905D28D|nr:putative methyltransferase DDB_G0268948 isoform X1 [Ylistrum balloti]